MTIPTAISRQLSKADRAKAKATRKKVIAEFNAAKNAAKKAEKVAKAEARAAAKIAPVLVPIDQLIAEIETKLASARQAVEDEVELGIDKPDSDASKSLDACLAEEAAIDEERIRRQEVAYVQLQAASAKRQKEEVRLERRFLNREKQIRNQLANLADNVAQGKKKPAQAQGKPSAKTAVRFVQPVLSDEQIAAKQAARTAAIERNRLARIAQAKAKLEKQQFRLLRAKKEVERYAQAA